MTYERFRELFWENSDLALDALKELDPDTAEEYFVRFIRESDYTRAEANKVKSQKKWMDFTRELYLR